MLAEVIETLGKTIQGLQSIAHTVRQYSDLCDSLELPRRGPVGGVKGRGPANGAYKV